MSKKAVSKWAMAFWLGFLVGIGLIVFVLIIFVNVREEICPRGQETQIQNVWFKVEEMRGKAGYETMYFEVKDCVEAIDYVEISKYRGNLSVDYTTVEKPIHYPTNVRWDIKEPPLKPGTYYLKVFEDHVEVS